MPSLFYPDISLDKKWTVWYHKQDELSWNIESYIKIYEFTSILEYVRFKNSFPYLPQFLNGYYFFMVDNIPPQWEALENKNGGCYYIPLSKDLTEGNVWHLLERAFLGELLLGGQKIYGLSIVPKKYNSLIKIWNDDKTKNDINSLKHNIVNVKPEDVYYRAHIENNNYGIHAK